MLVSHNKGMKDLLNMDTVISLLKGGCFITYKYAPNDKISEAWFRNTGPTHKDYCCKRYPLKDFFLLLHNGFLREDSGNFETREFHYYWEFEAVQL